MVTLIKGSSTQGSINSNIYNIGNDHWENKPMVVVALCHGTYKKKKG